MDRLQRIEDFLGEWIDGKTRLFFFSRRFLIDIFVEQDEGFFFLRSSPATNGGSENRTYLDTRFGQVDLEGDFFAHEDVRVACFGEQRLEDVELAARERRPFAALLPTGSVAPCAHQPTNRMKNQRKPTRISGGEWEVESEERISVECLAFTCSLHTWRKSDGGVERIHGGGWHRQSGQSDSAAHSDAQVLVVGVVQADAHTDAHADVHGVRVAFGQVGHDVGRVINSGGHTVDADARLRNNGRTEQFQHR